MNKSGIYKWLLDVSIYFESFISFRSIVITILLKYENVFIFMNILFHKRDILFHHIFYK